MTISTRDAIAYCSIQEEGNWDKIYARLIQKDLPSPERIEDTLSMLKCQFVTIMDQEYPEQLKHIYKPPFCLFYQGDISFLSTPRDSLISVVGSREYSEYGEKATKIIVTNIARDFVIVSGLAKGIDAIAAETTINAGGKTIAILGSGIDYCYPIENLDLFLKIKEQHLLLSEYPPGTVPSPDKFPMRNRIIAGLSKAVVVTEAGIKSGTSITVNLALMFGKDILCVPYPIGEATTCNRLIKEGAYLVENGDDVRKAIK